MLSIRQEISLMPYNTFAIDATASAFIEADDENELCGFLKSLPDPSSVLILGGGSNVLFVSGRYNMVARPVFKGVEILEETGDNVLIRAKAGEVWDEFVDWCVGRNYSGIENLSGIPGMTGASPIQNIGAYGVEVNRVIEAVETVKIITGEKIVFNNEQCGFGYRDSIFKRNAGKYLITAVQFRLNKNFSPSIQYTDLKTELLHIDSVTLPSVRKAVLAIRERKLPDTAHYGNAGSFFKNPTIEEGKSVEMREIDALVPLYPIAPRQWKISAAWLIQRAGWKGVRDGCVGTHDRQALVIVNYGHAAGKDILDFAGKIIRSVDEKFGIRLEPEVRIVSN
jgi:UDP-N-acetylmuramate dehydrogenase